MARLAQAWLLVLDGRESVLHFDEVGQPVFSPDGARVAYSAKREKKWFVILGTDVPASSYEKTGRPVFSRDGQHLAFPAKRSGKWLMVSDGREAGGQFEDVQPGMFSPDGKRLAYSARRGAKWIAVLDGKEGPPFDRIDGPAFSPDGRRFGYEGTELKSSFTGDKGRGRVVVDGEQGPECEGSPIQLVNRQLLDPRQWSGLLPWALTRGGLNSGLKPRLLYRFLGVSAPVFSGDGARVAYACRRAKNDEAVFVDGALGPAFRFVVGQPAFSADGLHVAFAVADEGATSLFVDGERVGNSCPSGTDYVYAIVFAPDNRRVALVAVSGGGPYESGVTRRAKRRVFVDGQAGTQYDSLDILALGFSADSCHLTCVVDDAEDGPRRVSFVVVDGTEGKRYDRVFARTLAPMETVAMTYAARAGRKFVRVTQPLPTLP